MLSSFGRQPRRALQRRGGRSQFTQAREQSPEQPMRLCVVGTGVDVALGCGAGFIQPSVLEQASRSHCMRARATQASRQVARSRPMRTKIPAQSPMASGQCCRANGSHGVAVAFSRYRQSSWPIRKAT